MAFGRQVADTERRYLYALRLVLLLRYKRSGFPAVSPCPHQACIGFAPADNRGGGKQTIQ